MAVPRPDHSSAERGTWLTEQADRLASMAGATVLGWRGIEMAVRDGDSPQPQFGGDDVPCVVCLSLTAVLNDGTALQIETDQDDDMWGLLSARHSAPEPPLEPVASNGYRTRNFHELPTGTVTATVVRLDAERDIIAEVALRVGGQDLLLIAGEPNEDWNGQLTWARLDESVLAFPQADQADLLRWFPERTSGNLREIL